MADDGSSLSAIAWPVPKFNFLVNWDSTEMAFQEISGLEAEVESVEYRHGNSPVLAAVKMPGLGKNGNITMKRGVFVSDDKFYDWYHKVEMNTMEGVPITIQLLDENQTPVMTWKLPSAWPVKISGADMQSQGSDVAIGLIEISH